MATLNEITQEVIQELSQVAGVSVQTYAEPRIQIKIQRAFDIIFRERFWSDFRFTETWTLTGTTGVPTIDISAFLKDTKDVLAIFPDGATRPLIGLPSLMNPNTLSGTRPRFHERVTITAAQGHYFRVWPKTATGDIVVIGRTKPDKFQPTTEIGFDDVVLRDWAVWDYLVDDGHNPDQADKYQKFFLDRLQQLKNDDSHIYLPLSDPAQSEIPNQWFVE